MLRPVSLRARHSACVCSHAASDTQRVSALMSDSAVLPEPGVTLSKKMSEVLPAGRTSWICDSGWSRIWTKQTTSSSVTAWLCIMAQSRCPGVRKNLPPSKGTRLSLPASRSLMACLSVALSRLPLTAMRCPSTSSPSSVL